MSAIQCRNRQNIHEGEDNRKECCHVPELMPIPCSREDASDSSEATQLLGAFFREEIFHLSYIAFQSLYSQCCTSGERGQKTIFFLYNRQ